MHKRGQIALFVIIALLIVGGAFAVLYTQTDLFKKTEQINPEIAPINSFIKNCVKSVGEDALIITGLQGGYFNLPSNSFAGKVYYAFGNKSFFPKKQDIEGQISYYMNEKLPLCTNNFADFPDFIVNASKEIVSKSSIIRDKVKFDVNWNVLIKKGDSIYRISSFSNEVPSRLNTIYSINQRINEENLEGNSFCISCIANLGAENNIRIDVLNFDNSTRLFVLTDNQTLIDNTPYQFIFMDRY